MQTTQDRRDHIASLKAALHKVQNDVIVAQNAVKQYEDALLPSGPGMWTGVTPETRVKLLVFVHDRKLLAYELSATGQVTGNYDTNSMKSRWPGVKFYEMIVPDQL